MAQQTEPKVGRADDHQRRRLHRQGDLDLEDPYERIGAELVKEVAKKTDDVAGDGTTTATVLAQALVREGLRNVAAGANPIALKRGIEKAVEAVTEQLLAQAKEVETKEEMAAVAAISSLVSTSLACASSCSVTASTAFSMPRLRAIGLAPAATLRRPSRTIA